jgi:hypothetical protein
MVGGRAQSAGEGHEEALPKNEYYEHMAGYI